MGVGRVYGVGIWNKMPGLWMVRQRGSNRIMIDRVWNGRFRLLIYFLYLFIIM